MTKTLGGALFVCALAAGNAVAALDTVKFSDIPGKGTTNGGAFLAETGTRGAFETFCIERDEYLNYGTTYYYSISDAAINGGLGGGNPDYITDVTRNIYYSYRTGTIASILDFVNDGVVDGDTFTGDQTADAVQNSVWYEEDELGSISGLALQLWSYFGVSSNWDSGAAKVKVMNVWANSDGTGNKQDQLIIVPLPTTSGLACAGLLGLVSIRRRRA